MRARRVIYFHFSEPKSSITRQHGNVPMSLAIDHYFIEDLPPNAFKTAVEIVKADSGEHRGHQVVNFRTQPLAQLIATTMARSEEHTSELQSLAYLVCRLLLEKKNKTTQTQADDTSTRPHN